ncbi:MAG: methylated-DNA--[protein]-cysteine S-methyltransferase [Opitutaceae bacterium]|nr:methylated-DNA--[protein]-cysteine S-methyltransferase [Opitutaceae bacterium]
MSLPLFIDSWNAGPCELALACEEDGAVVALSFHGLAGLGVAQGVAPASCQRSAAATHQARSQLDEYFRGERRTFDLRLAPRVGTDFQRRVWRTLAQIPYGATWSYARLASATGSVARAVGGANGANPIPIIWPCHRVIGANGSLTGFAGGLELKRWLLRHEGALALEAQQTWC